VEPALGVLIEVAAWISNLRTVRTCGAIDGGSIAVELVERDNAEDSVSGGAEDAENIVCRLEDEAVSSAETLIGGFNGELISTVGIALLVEAEAIDAEVHHRVGLGVVVAGRGCARMLCAVRDGSIDGDRTAGIVAAVVRVSGERRVEFGAVAAVHRKSRGSERPSAGGGNLPGLGG